MVSNLSLSPRRDCSFPCIFAHQNVEKQFTWPGPTYPRGNLLVKLYKCLVSTVSLLNSGLRGGNAGEAKARRRAEMERLL